MRVLFILFSILAIQTSESSAADHVLKWGINVEPIIYFQKAAREFKTRVEQRSKGKIQVELFENGYKQEERDHLADVQNGMYDMGQESVFRLQAKVPELGIWNLPYLFTNDEHVTRYITSAPAKDILLKMEDHQVVGLGYTYSGGFLHFFGKKMESFKDLSKLNVGFEEGPEQFTTFLKNTYKITTADMDFNALAAKKLSETASEIIVSTARELYPSAKKKKIFLNSTDHRVVSRVLFISKKFLSTLPEDLKKIVLEEGQRAAVTERNFSIEDKQIVLKEVENHNITINKWSDEKKLQGRKQFLSLYEAFSKQFTEEPVRFVESLR